MWSEYAKSLILFTCLCLWCSLAKMLERCVHLFVVIGSIEGDVITLQEHAQPFKENNDVDNQEVEDN